MKKLYKRRIKNKINELKTELNELKSQLIELKKLGNFPFLLKIIIEKIRDINCKIKDCTDFIYKTPVQERIRDSIKYKQWRQSVFIRDNFTCQYCGAIGGKLRAHHKDKRFSQLFQEIKENLPLYDLFDGAMLYTPLWDINNGITLCSECHKVVHKKIKNKINEDL